MTPQRASPAAQASSQGSTDSMQAPSSQRSSAPQGTVPDHSRQGSASKLPQVSTPAATHWAPPSTHSSSHTRTHRPSVQASAAPQRTGAESSRQASTSYWPHCRKLPPSSQMRRVRLQTLDLAGLVLGYAGPASQRSSARQGWAGRARGTRPGRSCHRRPRPRRHRSWCRRHTRPRSPGHTRRRPAQVAGRAGHRGRPVQAGVLVVLPAGAVAVALAFAQAVRAARVRAGPVLGHARPAVAAFPGRTRRRGRTRCSRRGRPPRTRAGRPRAHTASPSVQAAHAAAHAGAVAAGRARRTVQVAAPVVAAVAVVVRADLHLLGGPAAARPGGAGPHADHSAVPAAHLGVHRPARRPAGPGGVGPGVAARDREGQGEGRAQEIQGARFVDGHGGIRRERERVAAW